MPKIILFLFLLSPGALCAQEDSLFTDSLKEYTTEPVPVFTDEYLRIYNRVKKKVVKLYPYALYAADLIDEIDSNSVNIKKRRKQNKFYKNSYSDLKDEFKYFVLDLYRSEGRLLMQLVHLETDMTIYEISEQYRGSASALTFKLMAKIWDQDLTIKFDTTQTEDRIALLIVEEIEAGHILVPAIVKPIDKQTYKENMDEYKERIKRNKKKQKALKKQQRKAKK
jgi:hypothetical protein